jgi:hypothetical protein
MSDLKKTQRHIPGTLLCLSVLLALLIAAKVSAFVLNANDIPDKIAKTLNAPGRNEENIKRYQAIYTKATTALKKKNLFLPPTPPKRNPVTKVTAIFGDEAMIANKWYKVGDKIQDAEITSISPNLVTVIWNEKETKLQPFDTVVLAAAKKPGSDKIKKDKEDKGGPRPDQMGERPPRPGGMPSMEERPKRMPERRNMSDEDKAKFREKMKSRGSNGGGRPRGRRSGGDRSSRMRGGR